MPSSTTGDVPPPSPPPRRRARSLGHRALAPTAERKPSVIESPKATMVPPPAGARARMSTSVRKYQCELVTGNALAVRLAA